MDTKPLSKYREMVYGDVPGNLYIKTRTQFDTNIWKEAYAYSDEFGRTTKTRTKDASGDVIVETKYDLMGRVSEVSNPYREGAAASNILWSKTVYDEAGRVATVYSPKPFGQTGDSIGTNEYGIINEAGLVGVWQVSIDASLRKKRTITNSLGQLARVDEATSFGGTIDADLGTLSSPQQATSYRYDIKGNMVEVTQGGQKRNFLYDSLGRLIRVKQPEQEVNASLTKADPVTGNSGWTAGFKYNAAGNLEETTDAEGNKITNTYDNADRVLTRSYSDGITPTVSYKYDLVPNGKGALIETSNSVSTSRTAAFDGWGRATQYQQVTDGQTYTSGYQYNLSGALVAQTYPSGRVVKNDFNASGDLSRIYGTANANAAERTYANSFSYMPDGRIEKLKLGNGLWESAKFNDRLQVTEFNLGHGAASGDVWKLGIEYGELSQDGTTVNTAKNTGNIARQTVSFNGLAQPFVQTYKYDALYRLKEATEKSGTQTNWSQSYNYDRYGNRVGFAENIGGLIDNQTPAVNPLTNRFTSSNYIYDKVGNIRQDLDENNQLRQFVFNGDNKQTAVMKGTVKVGEYFYDGDGKRVKKNTYDEFGILKDTTVFVYSGGKLIAEYSTKTPPQNPTTNYTMTDQLGSPRVITNSLGEVISRRDFLPFGEEVSAGVGGRTGSTGQKYSSDKDTIKQKFTGYIEDEETQLDFAEARMYENRYARFTAVDPLLASGKSANPQSFNRYVYVMNNPLFYTDPTGLQVARHVGKVYANANETEFSRSKFEGSHQFTGNSRYVPATDGFTYSLSSNGFYSIGNTEEINARAGSLANAWAQADSDTRNQLRYGSLAPSSWIPELMNDPPGYEEASSGRFGLRNTISPDGETNINQFYAREDEAKTLGLMGATQYVNLGGMRSPPSISPVSRTPSSGSTLFSNLFPKDTPRPILTRELSFDGNKWRATGASGVTVTPNGKYNFVVQNDKMFITRPNKFSGLGGHVDLSRGNSVQFAGEIRFGHGNNAGNLRFWNNASGHFRPPASSSNQAPLPQNLFRPRF